MSFPYKRILILGATSGIGRALAARFIRAGSSVIVSGRRQANLDSFVAEHGSDKASAVSFDVSDLSGIPAFVQKMTSSYPDLDLVFLNSGVQRGIFFSDPKSVDLSVVEEEMRVNYTAQVALTQAFLPFLLAKAKEGAQEPALLYTTSNLALIPMVRCPNYSASKAALHAMILCLRAQLQDSGVKVLELLPPAVQTELHDAKHQPDIKDGHKIGMPLDAFTEQAYEGLAAGNEQVLIGSEFFGDVKGMEKARQEMFWGLWEKTKPKAS